MAFVQTNYSINSVIQSGTYGYYTVNEQIQDTIHGFMAGYAQLFRILISSLDSNNNNAQSPRTVVPRA